MRLLKINHCNNRPNYSEIIIIIFLTIATLIVFWNVQNHEFINHDDPLFITENYHIQSRFTWKSISWAFTTTSPDYWHPLPWLSLILDYQLYGLNPKGYHLNNMMLHILNTLLLFIILKRE